MFKIYRSHNRTWFSLNPGCLELFLSQVMLINFRVGSNMFIRYGGCLYICVSLHPISRPPQSQQIGKKTLSLPVRNMNLVDTNALQKKRPLATLFKRHYSPKNRHQSLGVIYSASFAKCCCSEVWKFFSRRFFRKGHKFMTVPLLVS